MTVVSRLKDMRQCMDSVIANMCQQVTHVDCSQHKPLAFHSVVDCVCNSMAVCGCALSLARDHALLLAYTDSIVLAQVVPE
jgi:hypothetical protein